MAKIVDHTGKAAQYKVVPIKAKTSAQVAKEKEAAKAKKAVKK